MRKVFRIYPNVADFVTRCSSSFEGVIMRQLVLLASAVLAPVLAASTAEARGKDNPNYGYCKSGARVKDMKNCKENGGAK